MSDIDDMIPALKRSVSIPGGFDAAFPTAVDADLVGLLFAAVAEAQLDGFLVSYVVDAAAETVTPDMSREGAVNAAGALVLIYATYRVVLNELRNVQNRVSYVAGPAKYEVERTASLLNEILRQLNDRKKELLRRAEQGQWATEVYVSDLNLLKATSDWQFGPVLEFSAFRGA
jgi:hypothetical protein